MTAEQFLKSGQLDEAIEKLNGEVRDDPGNSRLRTFLFELLCIAGEFSRAERQLEVLAGGGPQAELGALFYKGALAAERTRQEMFLKDSYPGAAARSVDAVINGVAGSSLSDADPRIGANLEIFVAGTYMWMPFEMIETLKVEAPKRLRDLIWLPASIQTTKAFEGRDLSSILVPVLYPGSSKSVDANVRLGRATVWIEKDGMGAIPLGQKMLFTDGSEWPLLEVREIRTQAATAARSS